MLSPASTHSQSKKRYYNSKMRLRQLWQNNWQALQCSYMEKWCQSALMYVIQYRSMYIRTTSHALPNHGVIAIIGLLWHPHPAELHALREFADYLRYGSNVMPGLMVEVFINALQSNPCPSSTGSLQISSTASCCFCFTRGYSFSSTTHQLKKWINCSHICIRISLIPRPSARLLV